MPPRPEIEYSKLAPFCTTDRQREVIAALVRDGSQRKAARALGVHERNLARMLMIIKRRAASKMYAPEHGLNHPCPDPFVGNGYSVMTRTEEGLPIWYKFKADKEAAEQMFREMTEAFKDDIPRATPQVAPEVPPKSPDLLNLYVITDYHLGMRAWPEETRGEAWDTDIAEAMLVAWFEKAIAQSPDARCGVLCQLGDLLHFDGLNAVTPTSGHLLDADTRFQRLVRVAIRVIRRVVSMLLAKHETVHVIMAEGNHDIASSAWLREVFAAFYSDEPRVTVDTSPDPYYCVEWGQVALFFHHGHLKKQEALDKTFAAKFREVFGRTRKAYAHTGHLHHRKELESPLMPIRQHRTLAPNDSHGSRHGYDSGREAQVVTYHKTSGETQTLVICPEAIAA